MRIACIGRNGQAAQALAAAAARDASITLVQASGAEADLRDAASLALFVDAARPDVVVNTGAYNFVDRAETETELAFAINEAGPRALARHCRKGGIPFIHMSTDCVFSGDKAGLYGEDDAPDPVSAYGRSKLAGEKAVAEEYPDALTARVAWVFSEYAENFVTKMISFAWTQPVLRVVNDQVGPPTYAPDIAAALIRIAREKVAGAAGLSGLMHVVSGDAVVRSDMAVAIMDESRRQGGPFAPVEPVTTASFNAPARRPLNARLSNAKAVARLGLAFTPYAEALRRTVAGVLARG
jgi:dTDP-4-dehydrorhamnose reductase